MRHFFTARALTVLPPRTRTPPQSSVFRKMSKDAPRGPACLLDAESAPEDEPEGGFGLSTGALALVLGVAGFGRVSHHHVPDMEAVAHAAVLTKTAEATTSVQSKYSGSLLPAATSARGKARPPASIAGQDPHFRTSSAADGSSARSTRWAETEGGGRAGETGERRRVNPTD